MPTFMNRTVRLTIAAALACSIAASLPLLAQETPDKPAADLALTPLELSSHATLTCIGVQWKVSGDSNANATGTLEYREKGSGDFKPAFPLHRSPARLTPLLPKGNKGKGFDEWPEEFHKYALEHYKQNYLAGSILNLKPATTYEVRVTLSDPDGGGTSKTIEVATRPEPAIPANAHVINVTGGGDALKTAAKTAKAGDVLVVHAGTYNAGIEIKASGSADKPLCIKAAGDGEVLLSGGTEGKSKTNAFEISGKYVYLQGLSFYNFANCAKFLAGADNGAVMHCKMTHFYTAIRTSANDGYFADNFIRESFNAIDLTVPKGQRNEGHGVQVEPSTVGNVMCYNAIANVADAIRSWGRDCDTYNNDVIFGVDDFIELDDSGPNNRVWENRVSYCGENGISFQPYIGGPAYIVRNVIFGQRGNPIKNRFGAEAGIFINNTFVGNDGDGIDMILGAYTRNNLFLVAPGKSRSLRINLSVPQRNPEYNMDYDAVGSVGPNGKTIKEFADETGLEKHGIQFTGGNEEALAHPPAIPQEFKGEQWATPEAYLKATDRPHPDLSLKPGSPAIAAGIPVPNIAERSDGKAPDLGALQHDQPMPHYGPR